MTRLTRRITRPVGRVFRYFETLRDPFADHPAETPPSALLPYLISHARSFGWGMLGIISCMTLSVALLEVFLLFYTGRIIDLMAVSGPEGFWSTNGMELILVALLILILRPLVIALAHLLLEQTLVGTIQEQVRWRAHKHLLGQSMGFFQDDFAGRLSNRVIQQGASVEEIIYSLVEAVWFAGVYVISAAILIMGFNAWLLVPLGLWLVGYVTYTVWLARRVSVASEAWSDGRSLVTGRVVDAYTNMETVKLFADDTQEERYVLSAFRRLRVRLFRFLRLATEMHYAQNVLNGALITGVIGTALLLWSHGVVTVGEVAAASALVIRLNGMSGWIMWVTIRFFENIGTVSEGLRSISVPQDVTDVPGAPSLLVSKGEISFDRVTHHYGKGKGGLDDLSLTITPGEKVGLVGRSGAGKSSMVNLLLRFRDAEAGRILIDGQDVATVRQTSLRQQIGMVTQDSSLLHRSIRANLLYGRPEATEAQIIDAARQASAHDFILGLQDRDGRVGYDAHVGERGVKLSGGQRQRIALARVILKNAPILVLDEATSALDSEVEAQIQTALYGVMEGKTVIAIAHRLSTIAHMDRIVVMEQGRIAEQGTHGDLLAQGGLYAGFWDRQSGGFLGADPGVRAAE